MENPSKSKQNPQNEIPGPACEIANVRRRLLALTYDAFLILAILFCFTMLYTFILVILNGSANVPIAEVQSGDVLTQLEPVEFGWHYYPLVMGIYVSFFIYFWRKTGQTLGMQAWRIRLVNTIDKDISYKQCIIRLVVSFISFFTLGIGYFVLWRNRDSGTWHDKASSTRVIKL